MELITTTKVMPVKKIQLLPLKPATRHSDEEGVTPPTTAASGSAAKE